VSWFGVGLVIAYGLGLAVTLTAAGLLLLGLRDRPERVQAPTGCATGRTGSRPRPRC
jgi:hypothetical protein